MRRAQASLARFMPLIDWTRFRRRPLDLVWPAGLKGAACGDGDQAVIWAVRTRELNAAGMVAPRGQRRLAVAVPGLDGPVEAVAFDTVEGRELARTRFPDARIDLDLPGGDMALAVRRI